MSDFNSRIYAAFDANDLSAASKIIQEAKDQKSDTFERNSFQAQLSLKLARLSVEMVQLLLDEGLVRGLKKKEVPGCDPPLYACIKENAIDNVRVLLEAGADPNADNSLFWAIRMQSATPEQKIAMVELLHNHGAELEKSRPNLPGYTPYLYALDEKAFEVAEYLKSRGTPEPELEEIPPVSLDLATFQERLVSAIRQCWRGIQEHYPNEKFCMFGLETDSDFITLNILLDSQGAIERDSKNRTPHEHYVARISLDSDSEFYGKGREYVAALSSELNFGRAEDEADAQLNERKRGLVEIFTKALQQTDEEGLFGQGPVREEVILLVSIMDASQPEWDAMVEIVRKLNPTIVSNAFTSTIRGYNEA